MKAVDKIVDVERRETRHGNTRFTVRDAHGHEYVTFRPPVGEQAERLKGKTVRMEFHEEQRGEFQNVYLDAVEAANDPSVPPVEEQQRGDEADALAWQTAAEVAPLIVGRDAQVSGEELFELLRPFKERVAQDIRRGSR
jgi:hypothetical protein